MDCICVRGTGAPLLLARVRRGGSVFALRSQLAAAGLVEDLVDGRAGGVDAQPDELAALKALAQGAALPQSCLVDVRRLVKRSAPGHLDIVLARMLFTDIQPLPDSLPECAAGKRGALLKEFMNTFYFSFYSLLFLFLSLFGRRGAVCVGGWGRAGRAFGWTRGVVVGPD